MAKKQDFGPIVGSWQMVEAWDMDDPGKPGKSYPWGDPPLGYWVYDSAGNLIDHENDRQGNDILLSWIPTGFDHTIEVVNGANVSNSYYISTN